MALIGSVADDLTGGTTTGVLLARSQARTAVFFDVDAAQHAENMDDLDAIVVSTGTRPLPANEAYEIVSDATGALVGMGCKYFQKRIDTTCRGGIGVEIDAMLDTLGDDTIAIVVPAMPQSRRILVGGFSVIDGVALINTPVAQDVRTPVKENYIPKLLAGQTNRKVGLVTLDYVLKGDEAIRDELIRQRNDGCEVIVVDAITIEDVENIAQAAISTNWDFITVDPGPFTAKVAYHRSLIGMEAPNLPPQGDEEGKTILIVAGSATSVTKKQMEVLCQDPRHYRISIDPEKLIDGGDNAMEEINATVAKATELINGKAQPRAILFETALHGTLLNLSAEENKRHIAPGSAADRINAGLGLIAQGVIDAAGREKVAGIYATGGDTMVFTCTALGVKCLEVFDYVIPQTDIGALKGGNYNGMPIVGKGGLTGNDNTALDIVERLFNEAARMK